MNNRLASITLMVAAIAIAGVPAALGAGGDSKVKFPDTNAGRRAAAYIKAFNSMNDDDMRSYFEANVAPEALAQRPIEQRLTVTQRLRADAGALEPMKILEAREDEIACIIKGAKGMWFEWTFRFEKSDPNKLIGASVEMLDEPPDLDEPTTPLTLDEALVELEARFAELAARDEFSGVVLVAKGPDPVFKKAYGLASKEYNVPNRLDTRFNLGSLNKVITRIAIEQLVGKGALSLDDKLGRHIPDYPNKEAAEKVTIRHLLDMTSGIGDFFGDGYAATPKDRIRSLSDYLPLFASEPLLFEPGMKNQYSNGGYVVLGLIIEKVSGESYYDYTSAHIYEPCGMKGTQHLDADVPAENVATGYTRSWDESEHPGEPRRNNIYTRPARGAPPAAAIRPSTTS